MNQANKLAFSMTPLISLGLPSMLYFVFSCFANLFSNLKIEICWEAGILAVVCYGFMMISLNQLNIHAENVGK